VSSFEYGSDREVQQDAEGPRRQEVVCGNFEGWMRKAPVRHRNRSTPDDEPSAVHGKANERAKTMEVGRRKRERKVREEVVGTRGEDCGIRNG
jgi:hypothetical protein